MNEIKVTFSDFIKRIDFHDGSLLEVEYDEKHLETRIKVTLCPPEDSDEDIPETVYFEFCRSFLLSGEYEHDEAQDKIIRAEYVDDCTVDFAIRKNGVEHVVIRADEVYVRSEKTETEDYECEILAESENYIVFREFEEALLIFKSQNRPSVCIGDFFDNGQDMATVAVIDENENFVAAAGSRAIVYFLEEQYEPFSLQKKSNQWCVVVTGVYAAKMRQKDDCNVEILDSEGNVHRISFDLQESIIDECSFSDECVGCADKGCRSFAHFYGAGETLFTTKSSSCAVTSYFPLIETDTTKYSVILKVGNETDAKTIRCVSGITGENYLKSREMIQSAPCVLVEGRAAEILEIRSKLDALGIDYDITPRFDYTEDEPWE